ncbi:MAG: PepSY domain-containing protein [Clostridia bacterium]|nr:PepSY domain-containing protein [Clostridia bacterium]
MKKILSVITALALTGLMVFSIGVISVADNDKKPTKITAISNKTRSVRVGNTIKLRVAANGDDDYLYWSIKSGKNYIQIADDDRSDDDIKIKGKKVGTAKIVCKVKGTKKKITFTINVKKAKKVNYITAAKAKSIAFKDAKVKAEKVKHLKVVREKDDGRMIYDIDFKAGKYEYDYEINAKTGKIIDKDKDFID